MKKSTKRKVMKNIWILLAVFQGLLIMALTSKFLLDEERIRSYEENRRVYKKYIQLSENYGDLEYRLRQGYADITRKLVYRLGLGKPYHGKLVVDMDMMTVNSMAKAIGGPAPLKKGKKK